ncbi:MAG: hypothetical protein NVSMB27_03280 [Ktedonobacteraceae bacterium]
METSLVTKRYAYRAQTVIRYMIGLATGLTGVADMLSVIVPRLQWISIFGAWRLNPHHGIQSYTVVAGFFLIMLSYGLMRGKRQAWRITVALLLLSALQHLLRGGIMMTTLVALLLITILIVFARYFRAKSDPPSAWRGYIALLSGLGIVTFYTIGGFFVLYGQFEPVIDRIGIEEVMLRLIIHTHIYLSPGTQAFFFERALSTLCLSAVLYGMFSLLRPVAATLLSNDKERHTVASLTHIYGTNSISYFALSEEKAYFFSASGKTVISYVLEGSVAVVAGDPIGPDEELFAIIKQFVTFCNEQDWTIVFWQVRDSVADLYRAAGLHLLKIGEDAIIDTQKFSLKGGAMANVRSSAKRAEQEGVRVVFYHGRVTNTEQLAQMEQISRRWLAQKGGSEMGFSMGHFDELGDDEQIYALAVNTANKVHAFVTFVPVYGRNGWGLDLMRRAENSTPGTMELLLACSIDYLKGCGAKMVSLGLAPLSNINHDDEHLLDNSIDFLTHRFGNPDKNSSLFNFKKKFQPVWESRYLVYSSTLKLPTIGWALYHAHQRDVSKLGILARSMREWRRHRRITTRMAVSSGRAVSGGL